MNTQQLECFTTLAKTLGSVILAVLLAFSISLVI